MAFLFRRLMRAALSVGIVSGVVLSPPLATGAQAQLPDSGDILALVQVCTECHGEDGNSTEPQTPNLTGQNAEYLGLQLRRFRKHSSRELRPFLLSERRSHIMDRLAGYLEDSDIEALARHFAGLVCRDDADSRPVPIPEMIGYCARCHGMDGKSTDGLIPNLAGQSRVYMLNELKLMRESTLTKNRELILDDVSAAKLAHYHRTMGRWAVRISEGELNAAAEYYSGLSCN